MAPKLAEPVPPASRAVKYSATYLAEYMKTLDWHEKHVRYERVMQMRYGLRYRRALAAALANRLEPDKFLDGNSTGVKPRVGRAIPLPNIRHRDYRGYRQLTLHETFMRQVARTRLSR